MRGLCPDREKLVNYHEARNRSSCKREEVLTRAELIRHYGSTVVCGICGRPRRHIKSSHADVCLVFSKLSEQIGVEILNQVTGQI